MKNSKYKTPILIAVITGVALLTAQAFQSKKTEPDPACFASDALRMQFGDEEYAFPREKIFSVQGENLPRTRDYGSVNGEVLCQRHNDPPLKPSRIGLNILETPCDTPGNFNCRLTTINISISADYRSLSKRKELQKRFDEIGLDLCLKTERCKRVFFHDNLIIDMAFFTGEYPFEELDKTKKLVVKEINKYSTK